MSLRVFRAHPYNVQLVLSLQIAYAKTVGSHWPNNRHYKGYIHLWANIKNLRATPPPDHQPLTIRSGGRSHRVFLHPCITVSCSTPCTRMVVRGRVYRASIPVEATQPTAATLRMRAVQTAPLMVTSGGATILKVATTLPGTRMTVRHTSITSGSHLFFKELRLERRMITWRCRSSNSRDIRKRWHGSAPRRRQ